MAADTFRANPAFNTYDTLLELGTGEALVSFLDEKGTPSMVERAKILFPLSQIGAISESQREEIIKRSRLYGRYDRAIDRESAYEIITAATEEAERVKAENSAKAEAERQAALQAKEEARIAKEQARVEKEQARVAREEEKVRKAEAKKQKNSLGGKVLRSVVTAVTGVAAAALADSISSKVTGQKKTSKTSTGQKAVTKATRSATNTIVKELSRSILGNLNR